MNNKKYCFPLMEAQLRAFLENCRIKKGEPFTHTTKSPAGSYYIGEDGRDDFFTFYCNAVKKGIRPTVTERPESTSKGIIYGPLRVDFDLKSTLDNGLKRQYTTNTLNSIIEYYQEEIKKAVVDEEFEDKMLTCVVLEKKAPRVEEGKVKDGFHLHFPYFICEPWFQDEYLRTKITDKMIQGKIWDGTKFTETIDKFIDLKMGTKQWLMYGSAKAEGAEPFMVSRVVDHTLEDKTIDIVFEEEMVGRKSSTAYYLPRFLSIRGYHEKTPLKPEVESKRVAFKQKKRGHAVITKKRNREEVLADIKLIQEAEFMDMLSDDRADEYGTWLEVGFVLFNIGQGCDEALEMWLNFSKRSSKFVEGECEDLWSKMRLGDYTVGTIKHMARLDSPDRYNLWKSFDLNTQLSKSLSEDKPNEWDVAQVVLCMYKDIFKCADSKKDVWFHFDEHRWKMMDDGIPIKLKLSIDVVKEYYDFKSRESATQAGKDETERTKSEKIEKKCREMITALKTCAFQERVMKMCKVVFHDPPFIKKINENRMLFGCENGVLDLETGQFRPGRPDDCVTFSCGLNYPSKGINDKDDDVLEMNDFFNKVFPNVNRREYFLDAACATLEGGNVNKTFIVGTGDGDNAKTVTYSLLELVFGEYCIKFPRELLIVGKGNSSSGPRPELARVRGKRLAMAQEIAKTEVMNIGVIKELTGNDSFFARGMYERDATEVKPQFCLWMQCLSGETPISLPGGVSVPMKQLSNNTQIMSWDSATKGLKPAFQKKFLRQGIKKCITVTLQDGSNLKCTPDHRLLTKNGQWIEAQHITPGETELMMGCSQPCYTDLDDNCSYVFLEGYNLSSMDGKMKAMAVCRLLGYGIADGSLNQMLYPGHLIDAERIVDDIHLLTAKKPQITECNNVYKIHVPAELSKQISQLSPIQPGGRINNPMILPEFIFDEKCPTFLIREVLAGMFGGDGVIPCICKSGIKDRKMFSSLRYIASKINKYIPSLIEQFERLVKLLKDRFDIDSTIEPPLNYEKGKSRVQLNINKKKSVRTFVEKIGVRYCCHKAYRLTAVLSYYKYKDAISKQNESIVKRTIELVEKYKRQNPKAKIQQYTLDNKYVAVYDSTQKAQHATGLRHSLIQGACKRNENSGKSTSGGYIWKYFWDVPATSEDEPGCSTIKEAISKAIEEQTVIYNKSKLVTYTQVISRILKGASYTQQQNNDLLPGFLKETGLDEFCNVYNPQARTGSHYSVGENLTTLPCYRMKVVGVEDAGTHEVYDLTVEEPYSNYVSNGAISHNCNEPPKVPGQDEATWNRIRVIEYESKFVKPHDLAKWPVPEDEKDQFEMKRFKADTGFAKRLPELAPTVLCMLFERYKDYKKRGLREPEEVSMATNLYRVMNDKYVQFVEEVLEKVDMPEDMDEKQKPFLRLTDVHPEYTTWHSLNHSSYAKEKDSKITLLHELNKRLGPSVKQGKNIQGWYGWRIAEEVPADEKQQKLQDILSGKKKVVSKQQKEPETR